MANFLMIRLKLPTQRPVKRSPAHIEARSRVLGAAQSATQAKVKALLRRLEGR